MVLADGTGRRIRPICELRWRDVEFTTGATHPYGRIHWPGDTDKEGKAWAAPIAPEVRDTLLRLKGERGGIGDAPVFPSPKDPTKPISRHLADDWLRRAEKLAELEPQKGGAWHPYRRKWATERKHLPDVDVARAGGWSSVEALRDCYVQSDDETLMLVVLDRKELREVK